MSDQPVISFRDVSKRFTFTPERPQTLLESFITLFSRRNRPQPRTLWAVRDLSFDIVPGQAVGIIGRNGSGKSTLMKLATRILRPTSGQVTSRGRISALLELGAGFHPDLTGRENIYLNGSVLGLQKEEIEARFDAIVAFSELDEFIDMPVKHYSSGMYMRLGFSVAIHVDPDILIIDEILAVGDQAFQNKCLDRIFEMKQLGVTILLVTHELSAVRSLCSHLIWMDHGQVRAAGPTEEVVPQYLAYSQEAENRSLGGLRADGFRRWGTGEIEIEGVRFLNDNGEAQSVFRTGDAMTVAIEYVAHQPVEEPEFGLGIYRHDGVHVNGPNNRLGGLPIKLVSGPGVVCYRIERLPLLPAAYQVTVAVHDSRVPRAYDFHERAYRFRVAPGGTEELYGLVEMPATWQWEPDAQPRRVAPALAGERHPSQQMITRGDRHEVK